MQIRFLMLNPSKSNKARQLANLMASLPRNFPVLGANENACSGISMSADADEKANAAPRVPNGPAVIDTLLQAVPLAPAVIDTPLQVFQWPKFTSPFSTHGRWAILACLVFAGLQFAPAQEDATPEESRSITPLESRLISDSELDDYLETLAAILPMATQERDPFGSLQDPDAVPKAPPIAMPDMPGMPELSTPFKDVVGMINVTTVMPAERRFLIGTRSFGVDDVLTINFRGQPIRAKVEAVSTRQIRFRNLENGDIATRTLELLPPGMSAGGSNDTIPGLIPTGPNVPIDLD